MSNIDILHTISNEFSKENITWGIGGSLLLYFHGITKKYNDIDILINEEDALKANSILSRIARRDEADTKAPFCTKYFYKYKTESISLDVIGGFGINHKEGTYWLDFNDSSVVSIYEGRIPLSSLEDWYVLYQLIPGKDDKARLLEDYWRTRPVLHRKTLEGIMKRSIPKHIELKISKLLNSQLN
jgi:hypothetical protein